MRCHTMERGSKSERPGRLRMSQESTPEREHLHQGGVSARKNRLDEVLRAAWSSLLERAEDDVRMWTKGEAKRGRPVADARAGLPVQEVWTAFLSGILDFGGLARKARQAELHTVTDEQVTRIRDAMDSQQDSILSCLGWTTAFISLYHNQKNIDLQEKYVFRNNNGKISAQELRRRLLPQTWSALRDGRLEPWAGAPGDPELYDCLIDILECAVDKTTTGDVVELVRNPEVHRTLDAVLDEWQAPPNRANSTDASADPADSPVMRAFWDVAVRERLVGDEILEDAWDTARRLAEDEPGRISRVYEAQMETGLAHLAQHMLVDDVDTSSLRRRVPFGSPENPGRRRSAPDAWDRTGLAILELDFMERVRRCMRGTVLAAKLPGALMDEARRCCHWSGLGERTDRAVLLEGMVVSALLPGAIENRNDIAARRASERVPALRGGLVSILSFYCWKHLRTMRQALEPSSAIIADDDEDFEEPWPSSTVTVGATRAQDLSQRIPQRFSRVVWSRLHYWEFIGCSRSWTWRGLVRNFRWILKDVNTWIEDERRKACDVAERGGRGQ